MHVYTLGLGTAEGGPVPADDGGFIKDAAGKMVMTHREDGKLQTIAAASHGIAIVADYSDADTRALLDRIGGNGGASTGNAGRTVRIWDERFYLPLLAIALFMLPWFRKGFVVPAIALALLMPVHPAQAGWLDWFRNPDQQGAAAYRQGQYDKAAQDFNTPYRQGVAQYKAGQLDKAALSFKSATATPNGLDAEYNLGNAQLLASQPQAAIDSYQAVLKQRPNDGDAARNLAIAKKLLQQKKQQQQQQQQQQQNKNQQKSGGQGQQQKNQSAQNQSGQSQKNDAGKQGQQGQNSQQAQNQQIQNQQTQINRIMVKRGRTNKPASRRRRKISRSRTIRPSRRRIHLFNSRKAGSRRPAVRLRARRINRTQRKANRNRRRTSMPTNG